MRYLSTAAIISLGLTLVQAAARPGILKPLNPNIFENPNAQLSRRDVNASEAQFASLSPADQARLVFGSEGENGQLLLADMMLYAPDGVPIVMMERFEGLTSAVDCKNDGDGMSITFKDEAAFKYAVDNWKWINEDANLEFLMITNHAGCAPEDERQAYRITDVDNEEEKFKTHLKAVPAPWKDITGSFEMSWGVATLNSHQRKLVRRDLFGWLDEKKDEVKDFFGGVGEDAKKVGEEIKDGAKEIGKDIKEGAENALDSIEETFKKVGDFNKDAAAEFNLDAGTPNQRKRIFTDPFIPPRLTMDCANCFTTGKFKIAGKLAVDSFKVKEMSVKGSFAGFKAVMEIDTTLAHAITKSEFGNSTKTTRSRQFSLSTAQDPAKLEEEVELLAIPAPGAGVVVPNIFSLGLVGKVEAGFALTFKGTVGFTVGVEIGLPDNALINIDFLDPDKTTVSNWNGASIEPKFDVNNASITVDASVFVRPSLELGAEIESVGKLSASVNVNMPGINANATAIFNEQGACKDKPEVKTGAEFGLGGVVSLAVGVDAKILEFGGRVFNKVLASYNLFQLKKCFALPIPGFDELIKSEEEENAAANQTSKAALPEPTASVSATAPVNPAEASGTQSELFTPAVIKPSSTANARRRAVRLM